MSKACVPAYARAHLIAHPEQSPRAAAAVLGLAYTTIKTYRRYLIAEGVLSRQVPRPHPNPLPGEVIERLTAGESYFSIERHTDAPRRKAFQSRLRRRGLTIRSVAGEARYSPREVCALFGYARHPPFLRRLQAAGVRLQCDTGKIKRGSRTYISADDLMTFFDDPDNWSLFDLDQITDPDWRDYAQTAQDRHHLRSGACSGPPRACEACGSTHQRPQPHRRCRSCDAVALANRERQTKARNAKRRYHLEAA